MFPLKVFILELNWASVKLKYNSLSGYVKKAEFSLKTNLQLPH